MGETAVAGLQRGVAELVERSRAGGPMQDVPLAFVVTLIGAIANVTMDAIIREPGEAEARSDVVLEAAKTAAVAAAVRPRIGRRRI